tara:strand:- start:163 stop:453 length:291 start_codon:yes stop_codon:yes gene_type:complete
MYTPQELYAGNRNGQPLDPGLYAISMRYHFGGGKQQSTQQPKAAVQQNVTVADAGKKVKKPKQRVQRNTLRRLRRDLMVGKEMNLQSVGAADKPNY